MDKLIGILTTLLASSFLIACGGPESDLVETEDELHRRGDRIRFRSLADGSEIPGSRATLYRSRRGVKVVGAKTTLQPNQTVEVFFAIFNNPEECTVGNPVTGVACGPPDLFNEATNSSLQFIEVATAEADGRLRLPWLIRFDPAQCAGDPFPCNPVTNPRGAEVHVPLFEPNNGPGVQAAQWE